MRIFITYRRQDKRVELRTDGAYINYTTDSPTHRYKITSKPPAAADFASVDEVCVRALPVEVHGELLAALKAKYGKKKPEEIETKATGKYSRPPREGTSLTATLVKRHMRNKTAIPAELHASLMILTWEDTVAAWSTVDMELEAYSGGKR